MRKFAIVTAKINRIHAKNEIAASTKQFVNIERANRIVVVTILIVRETISVLEVTVQNATVTNQIVTVTIQIVTTTILVCSFYFNKQLF